MLKIPKEAFKTQSEDGSDVLPEVGDEVNLDGFSGTVQSEDGDNLVVNLTDFHGVPVEYVDDPAEEKAEGAPPDNSEADKKSLIEQMSKGMEE